MLSPELIGRIRVDLDDKGEDIWTEEKIRSAISSAVSDLSRVLPQEKRYDHTLDFTVTAEEFTAAAAGTYVALDNAMIEPQSETVTNAAADTTYTRDTDYTMDYINGEITIISTGDITAGDKPLITYTKSKFGCDVSDITSDLLRIERVEYPAGHTPQSFVSWKKWKDYLTLITGTTSSQVTLSDGKHVWVYYYADQVPPTATANGSYPVFLDEVIIVGAESYALFERVIDLLHAVTVDVASAKTAINLIDAASGDVDTPLDAVAIALARVEAGASDLLADAEAALDKVSVASDMTGFANTAFAAAAAEIVIGAAFLQTGDAAIPTANVGKDVPENWRQYAEAEAALASQYNREGEGRVAMANALVGEASQRIAMANAIIGEAAQHVALAQARISGHNLVAEKHLSAVMSTLTAVERVRAEAVEKRNMFWSILNDKLQLRRPVSSVPVRQPD